MFFFAAILLLIVGIAFLAKSFGEDGSDDDRLMGYIMLGTGIFCSFVAWSLYNVIN
jgi:drug/metabolite transporter (DMT)-like permease